MSDTQITNAVILVGGFGTRLLPLTLNRPKQMLPIAHKPMIEIVISQLSKSGIKDVVLALGYKPDAFIQQYPSGSYQGVDLQYAIEPEPLDTAGAIKFAAEQSGLETTSFLAVNGDVLYQADLLELMTTHFKKGAEATILTTEVDDASRYGVIEMGENFQVANFLEKPSATTELSAEDNPNNNINAGVYVFEPKILDRIETGKKVSLEKEIFPELIKDGSLFCHNSNSYWIDAGTPETYLQAQSDIAKQGNIDLVDASAKVDGEVIQSLVGKNVVVAKDAVVRNSVLLDGAVVQPESLLEDSIVGYGVNIGKGAKLKNLCVIGDGYVVPADTELDAIKLP